MFYRKEAKKIQKRTFYENVVCLVFAVYEDDIWAASLQVGKVFMIPKEIYESEYFLENWNAFGTPIIPNFRFKFF